MSSNSRSYFRDLCSLNMDTSLSLDEKIEQAISIGRDRLALQYGVLSYTAEGAYEVVGSSIQTGDYEAGTVHNLDETWCRHVVSDNETIIISDAENSRFADDIARETTGLQCYIGAPIEIDGETYGTLCYSDETPREEEFSSADQQFVELLTKWISYEIAQEKHYQTITAQNDRLNEFAGILAHDIRNPLSGAIGYTELALETAPESIADHLEKVAKSLNRIDSLITDTLSLARKGNDVGKREPVDLESVAQASWDTVSPTNATLTVTNNRTIKADESRLKQLLENLFRNVEDHCGDDVTVTVHGTDDGFVVCNDGPKMPEPIVSSLFGGTFGSERPGLGLLIIERIVSGHGWTGTVESTPEQTKFEFSGIGTATKADATV